MNTERITRRQALAVGLGAVGAACAGCAGPVAPAPVPKGDNASWIGKTILPKQYAPFGAFTQQEEEAPTPPKADRTPSEFIARLGAASFEVKGEKGTRLEVLCDDLAGSGTGFGWVEKDAFVELSAAVEFFTAAIVENEKDTFAIVSRGWAYYLLNQPEKALADFDTFLKLVPATQPAAENTPARWEGLTNRGLVYAEQGEFKKALADLDSAHKDWHGFITTVNRGYTRELMGEYPEALQDYEAAARRSLLAANNIAWLRATCPVEKFRDGKAAVELALKVCELTKNREGAYLDTLAAAYAEAGKFAESAKTQEKALEDKGYALKYGDDGRARLQLYKDKKPYRTEVKAEVKK